MTRIRTSLFYGMLALSVGMWAGCSAKPQEEAAHEDHDHDHDHGHDDHEHGHGHEHPETYAEGVGMLVELRDTVRDAFAKEDIDTAHGPLHDVGHLLEDLPKLAEKHDPLPDKEEVKQATDELFDLFTKVDEKLHGEEGTTYAEVSDKIDAAIERLKKTLGP